MKWIGELHSVSILLNTLAGAMEPLEGMVKWKKEGDDEQVVPGEQGRMLFGQLIMQKQTFF